MIVGIVCLGDVMVDMVDEGLMRVGIEGKRGRSRWRGKTFWKNGRGRQF